MRPINELRMKARWKLGGALAKVERKPGSQTLSNRLTSFGSVLGKLGLTAAAIAAIIVQASRDHTTPQDGPAHAPMTPLGTAALVAVAAHIGENARPL
jgi:hypothetical protein